MKNRQNSPKAVSNGYSFDVVCKINAAESIFGEIFTTGGIINLLTAHVQTLSSQKSPKMVLHAQNDHMFIRKRVR